MTAEQAQHEPDEIGTRVVDRFNIAWTRFSDSEAWSEGDWINEDASRIQWDDLVGDRGPLRLSPGKGGADG